MTSAPHSFVTAAVLVIGDEILSGRTKDKNIGYIAEFMTRIGVDLREVRVVPDIEAEIVSALDALRARYHHVFTTGGIGPTHDDITADAVAKAFGVKLVIDEGAAAAIRARVGADRMNAARLRMARIPEGGSTIPNSVSAAPGFSIGNVYVMAGVPAIMQAMLDALAPSLKTGAIMHSVTVDLTLPEGTVAERLGAIQSAYPDVMIGSYPSFHPQGPRTSIVLRSRDTALLAVAEADVRAMAEALAGTG
jgi:molybdenum cofactor synthesis domain-containing protein